MGLFEVFNGFIDIKNYFKQKEILHLLIIVTLTIAVFYSAYLLLSKLRIPTLWKIIAVSLILFISWLGPQLIYQVRPYTFYISGLVMAMIVVAASSSSIASEPNALNLAWKSVLFVAVFFIAYFTKASLFKFFSQGIPCVKIHG